MTGHIKSNSNNIYIWQKEGDPGLSLGVLQHDFFVLNIQSCNDFASRFKLMFGLFHEYPLSLTCLAEAHGQPHQMLFLNQYKLLEHTLHYPVWC